MLLGWAALPKPWLWTSAVLTVVFLPCVLASLLDLVRKPKAVLLSQHIPTALRFSRQRLTQAFLTLAFMPYEAWLSLDRSEEHTSELQSLMRISYAVFCLKKKKQINNTLTSTIEDTVATHRQYDVLMEN